MPFGREPPFIIVHNFDYLSMSRNRISYRSCYHEEWEKGIPGTLQGGMLDPVERVSIRIIS
jgi:hypothetical protein